jgi:hypothetical protein
VSVELDGARAVARLQVEVADLQPQVGVLGLQLEELQVLRERLVVLPLLRVLLRGLEGLALLGLEGQGRSSLARTSPCFAREPRASVGSALRNSIGDLREVT